MQIKSETFYEEPPSIEPYLNDLISQSGHSEEVDSFFGLEAYEAFILMVEGFSADIDYIERTRELAVDDFTEYWGQEHGDDVLFAMGLTQNGSGENLARGKDPMSIDAETALFDELGLMYVNNPDAESLKFGISELTHFQLMIDSDNEYLQVHHMDVGDPSFQQKYYGESFF